MRLSWVALVGACSFHSGKVGDMSDAGGDGPPDMMQMLGAWSAPVEITELTSGIGDDDPSLTADLTEIYFGSIRTGGMGQEDIWRATRASPSAAWDPPMPVTELNSSSAETTIKVSLDGLAIFFSSTRGTGSSYDLYFSTRATRQEQWKTPLRIDELSTNDGEFSPWPRNDLQRLVFCRGSNVPNEALYISERASTSTTWGTPVRITALDESSVSECDPIEPRADTLYYSSNRAGAYDIYVSRTPFTTATEVPSVNVPAFQDRDPWVSPDERYMVFASNRSGIDRLYLSTR